MWSRDSTTSHLTWLMRTSSKVTHRKAHYRKANHSSMRLQSSVIAKWQRSARIKWEQIAHSLSAMWMLVFSHHAMPEHAFFPYSLNIYSLSMLSPGSRSFSVIIITIASVFFLQLSFVCVCVCVCTFMNVQESTCHGILAEVREPLARVGCILASQESLVLTTDHRPWHRVRLLTEPPHLPLRWSWFSVHSLRGIFMNVSYSSLCELFKLASPKLLRALQNCWGLCCFCFLEEEVVRSTDNCTGR